MTHHFISATELIPTPKHWLIICVSSLCWTWPLTISNYVLVRHKFHSNNTNNPDKINFSVWSAFYNLIFMAVMVMPQQNKAGLWCTEKTLIYTLKLTTHTSSHYPPQTNTWGAEFLILFTLCSTGSKEAQDLHTKGPGEEHWSHPGAQWVSGTVSVSTRPLTTPGFYFN